MFQTERSLCARACFIVLAVADVAFVGCAVNKIQSTVPAFSQAVTLTSTNVEAAFTSVQTAFYDAQVMNYVTKYDGTVNPATIPQSWLAPDALKVRTQVLQGLKQYAADLTSLSTANTANLDSATTALGKSITDLTNTAPFNKMVSGTSAAVPIQVATTAVNALGNWLINRKLDKDLPSTIEKMDPPVQSICNLLAADIGTFGADPAHPDRGSGLRQVQWFAYNSQIETWNDYVLKNYFGDNYGKVTPESRLAAVKQLVALVTEQKSADQTLAQVAVTIQQMAKAHGELVHAVKTKQTFTAEVSDLVAEAQRLSSYYQSLANTK